MKKIILFWILSLQFAAAAFAQEAFVVKDIQIEGLKRTSVETTESYLSIKRGETLRPGKTAQILRSLYKTGFFDHISLSRSNHTLIIRVVERPTIGQLKITGNSVIPSDKLTKVMSTLGIAEGRVYNPEILEKIKQSLLNQYYQLGYYNAQVNIVTYAMPRNRIRVNINISEGLVAKIKRITIIGNHVFSEHTLIKQLDITTSNVFTIITQKDRYSEMSLDANVEKIRTYYLDHGYLQVKVKASQAEITPDRKSVYVTILIEEGPRYTLKDFQLIGRLVGLKPELRQQITLVPGETFSRQKILDTQKAISRYLGEKGYMLAQVRVLPHVNEKTHEVVIVFNVDAGKRIYVRHITFSDNRRTNDVVLRREVQQLEGAPSSTAKLETSKQRLNLLPYLRRVDMSVKPVENKDDQVDVNYKVEEDSSAQASFKLGYSQSYGFLIGAGVNQKNFLGTGNTLGVNLNRSHLGQYYGIDYTNPYFTDDGISQTFNASISTTNPGSVPKVNNSYSTNEYNIGLLYGIPVGQAPNVFSRIYAGISYQNLLIKLSSNPAVISNQVLSFVNRHGRRFQEADFKLGYTRDSRDKAIFPTSGMLHSFFADVYAPLSTDSLSFYTLNYHGKWYQPLVHQFILLTRADFGYGNGFHGASDFPFFKNYYAGGIDSVRGYLTYNLGPRDSHFLAYGGNILADASVGLIFPNYLSENLRTVAFVDAGNVYSSLDNRKFGGQSTNSGPIRYSMGIEADWLTPFGPVQLSLATPINPKSRDQKDAFQFALGANF